MAKLSIYRPRPIVTDYNGGHRVAHSCDAERAIIAAQRRITQGDFEEAVISDGKKQIARVRKTATTIITLFAKKGRR